MRLGELGALWEGSVGGGPLVWAGPTPHAQRHSLLFCSRAPWLHPRPRIPFPWATASFPWQLDVSPSDGLPIARGEGWTNWQREVLLRKRIVLSGAAKQG